MMIAENILLFASKAMQFVLKETMVFALKETAPLLINNVTVLIALAASLYAFRAAFTYS
jgi:hypothetical protein